MVPTFFGFVYFSRTLPTKKVGRKGTTGGPRLCPNVGYGASKAKSHFRSNGLARRNLPEMALFGFLGAIQPKGLPKKTIFVHIKEDSLVSQKWGDTPSDPTTLLTSERVDRP